MENNDFDITIIGGGPAGLIAANKIKEVNASLDVLIVDKAHVGYSGGKANKGAGVLFVLSEDDDIDKFREFHLENIGHYLNDQEMLEIYAGTTLRTVEHFEKWSIPIMRDENGRLARIEELPLWSLCAFDLNMIFTLRKQAIKRGVKTVDKTQVVELLTTGSRVVGAVGFDIVDGTFRTFKAKSVILASGSCNWMVTNMWMSGRGGPIRASSKRRPLVSSRSEEAIGRRAFLVISIWLPCARCGLSSITSCSSGANL